MTRQRLKTRRLLLEALECRKVLDAEGMPWLMAPDLTISFAPDGTDVAGYASRLQETMDAVAVTSAWQDAIVRAFETWAQYIGTDVNVVGDSGDPFGAPGLTQGDGQFGDVRIAAIPLQPDVIAISIPHNDVVSGTWAGDILFNSSADLQNLDELFSVALHEAGHVFGLGHSTDAGSVMYRHGISPVLQPTARDIFALQQLYGSAGDVDDYFGSGGDEVEHHGDGDDDGDDDIATPRQLSGDQQLWGAIRFDAAGEISSASDVDFYQLGPAEESLDDALDELEVLTVTLWVAGPPSQVPHVQIVQPSGEVIQARILSNSNGRIVLQADDVSPEEEILVKVQSANAGGAPAPVAYRLSARFGATETRLVEMAQGTLDAADPAAVRVLHVSQSSLMHLVVAVDPIHSAMDAAVSVVVSDASGRVMARIDSSPGSTNSAPTFLLNPGDYRVEITAVAPSGQRLPEVDFTLTGIAISVPIGSVISDPTGDPTMICDPGTGSDGTCTVLDPAVTSPIVVPPPPLPPPPDPVLVDPVFSDPILADPVLGDPALFDPTVSDPVLIAVTASDPALFGLTNPLLAGDAPIEPAVTFSSLTAADSWFNAALPSDVNGDGIVSPVDALIVINYLNSVGAGKLGAPAIDAPQLDVNHDGDCSAVDVLCVINSLNASPGDAGVDSAAAIGITAALADGTNPNPNGAEESAATESFESLPTSLA